MSHPCFGSAALHQPDGETCRGCDSYGGCQQHAYERLSGMVQSSAVKAARLHIEVARHGLVSSPRAGAAGRDAPQTVVSRRGRSRFALSPALLARINRLPRRVAEEIARRAREGWFTQAAADLAAKKAPGGPAWLRLTCAKLLQGGFTRDQLCQSFVTDLKWSPAAARAQVSVAVGLCVFAGLARDSLGMVTLNPNGSDSNEGV